MKAEEIRGLAADELASRIRELEEERSVSASGAAPKRWKSRCGCAASAGTSRA
jgi:hypothetical protein